MVADVVICIDIGGTKISVALLKQGEILEQKNVKSPLHSDIDNLMNVVYSLCQEMADRANQIAIACTGLVGREAVNFLSVKKTIPVKQLLENKFKLPVTILNDAAAAAWAEYLSFGADRPETLVYVTVSTGIGAGIVQNGQLITSEDGFSAHLGHLSVPSTSNITCHCGRNNCIEALSSGTAIGKRASVILGEQVSAKDVFEYHLDQPEIQCLIEHCAEDLVKAFASIKAMSGTSILVMGGSVGLNPVFREKVANYIRKLPELYQFRLTAPKCGANADIYGAFHFALGE